MIVKKQYIVPAVKRDGLLQMLLLCASGVSGSGIDAGYGGVDESGSKDPASRTFIYDNWEDEEEENF